MAGVLDPVGPERPRTYWLRRAAVIVAVLALIVVIVVAANAIAGAGGSGDREAAPPPGGPTLQPSAAPTSATPTPEDSGPESSRSPSPSRPSPSRPAPSPSADGSPSASRSGGASSESTRSAEPGPSPTTSSSRATRECDDDDLRATLTGPRQIEVGTDVTFRAGVINGGTEACRFVLDPDDYEFRIYSGTDRIWSTDDCERWIPKVDVVLGPEKATEWTIAWSVTRSQGCGATKDVLRPGTYAANSVLDDVEPAQLVMTLT